MFEKYTLLAINKGFQHFGAKAVFEWIRFQTGVFGNGDYKVNNSFTADYSRLFEKNNPQHEGIFEKRTRKIKINDNENQKELFT